MKPETKANIAFLKETVEKEMGAACRFDLGHPRWGTWNRVEIDKFVRRRYPKLFNEYCRFFYKIT